MIMVNMQNPVTMFNALSFSPFICMGEANLKMMMNEMP